ncbi:MAG TPA: hypothetical protein VNT75_10650, partial [Symbiobacteriaceae bacterium]|nr:hypothetical protein [Symbiobacteriaceae bacterium]
LGDGRYDVLTHPWIPFAPAVAFLVTVIGFNLISQGLETIVFSVQEIKERTTARLSARWRWSVPVLLALAVGWYFQGTPWGREAGIRDLAARQATALTQKDVAAYVATVRSNVPAHAEDLRRALTNVLNGDVQVVSVEPSAIKVTGNRATANWRTTIGRRSEPPLVLDGQVKLVRRWGRWYDTGANYQIIPGFHTDVAAVYDPLDPSSKAISWRWNVQFLATAVDHAYEAVAHLFPEKAGAPRPMLKLYPNAKTLREVVGSALPEGETIWYEPGQPIRMSPDYLKGSKRWDVERSLAFEMMKFLTETRLGSDRVSPLTIGTWDLHQDKERSVYRIYTDRLAGYPFLTLDEVFTLPLSQLSQQRQYLFVTQAALLAEYAEARLTERPILATTPAELAGRLGLAPEALAREYYAYVQERVFSESLLEIPAAKPRIPAGLAEAIEAAPAPQPGLAAYRARLVDFTEQSGTVSVLLLEQATLADGRAVSGVVSQTWRKQGNEWVRVSPGTLIPS